MDFVPFKPDEFVLLDGAMGTMLQKKGLQPGEQTELASLEHPGWLREIHGEYVAAGTQILLADTFGANREKLAVSGRKPEEIIPPAIVIAKEAATEAGALVALDIGPLPRLLEPAGDLIFDEAVDLFREMMLLGEKAGADLIVLETMANLQEVRAGLIAAKETNLPVCCTMTFEGCGRTYMGCSLAALGLTAQGLGAFAVGVNCSLGPRELPPLMEELARWTSLPLIAKPNAGLPTGDGKHYDITAEEFADYQKELARMGVRFLGGCCGTDPSYIALLKEKLMGLTYSPEAREMPAALCTESKTVLLEDAVLSPQDGLSEELLSGDADDIMDSAMDLLDEDANVITLSVPEDTAMEEEEAALLAGVRALHGNVDAPVCIVTRRPAAAEKALRECCGRALLCAPGEEGERTARTWGALWKPLP